MTYRQWLSSLTEDDINWYLCVYRDYREPLKVAYDRDCEDKK